MNVPWKGAARPLSSDAFEKAAERIGCDVPAIKAVWEVEAAGRHFLDDGTVIRRFEPHHFPRDLWPQIGFSVRNGEAPWRASLRLSGDAMFDLAYEMDPEAAMGASSWGAPQIMGAMNHRAAGFDSTRAMVEHMAEGADEQLGAFVQLVESWGIDGAIRGHDWRAFARRYNGSGQVDEYARRMEAAYRRHSGGKKSPQVLRVGDRGAAVRRLQEALRIEADGAFGPSTLAAVETYQEGVGLPVDGIVGARTWAAIERRAGALGQEMKAPAQETPADAITDHIKKLSGAAAAVSAVAASIGEFRGAIPADMFQYVGFGAATCAMLFAVAWTVRWVRA